MRIYATWCDNVFAYASKLNELLEHLAIKTPYVPEDEIITIRVYVVNKFPELKTYPQIENFWSYKYPAHFIFWSKNAKYCNYD